MANQENGNIKQMKLRLPMFMFRQLQIDAEARGEEPSTRARHILGDALMGIDVSSEEEKAKIREMVDANWAKINGKKGE